VKASWQRHDCPITDTLVIPLSVVMLKFVKTLRHDFRSPPAQISFRPERTKRMAAFERATDSGEARMALRVIP
jgi:hypothetical protein